MESRFGSFVLDDDAERVDHDVLAAFLLNEAYWERWRTRAELVAQLQQSWRVVGAYEAESGAMVGFSRAVSDGVAFAYLDDVFILPSARGRGLGVELVRVMIEAGPGAGFRWLLDTDDADGLYRRFGFSEPGNSLLERPSQH